MERSEALSIVKTQLTEKRYSHTVGVMDTAVHLAKLYGEDEKKAELAAIFHDYAKFRPLEEMKEIIIQEQMPSELLAFNGELWHAPVGAYLVSKEVGINDPDILNAIRYHTSGRPDMSLLEKIIYVADYIEPGRNFPGVDEARRLAAVNLDEAILFATGQTISFLVSRRRLVFPLTLETYNAFVKTTLED